MPGDLLPARLFSACPHWDDHGSPHHAGAFQDLVGGNVLDVERDHGEERFIPPENQPSG